MDSTAAVEVRIAGIVQGVGFRFFAERLAHHHGLTGYVENRHDGSVYVVAEGERAAIVAFLAQLKKGPPGAVVKGFDITWGPPQRRFRDFTIRFSG